MAFLSWYLVLIAKFIWSRNDTVIQLLKESTLETANDILKAQRLIVYLNYLFYLYTYVLAFFFRVPFKPSTSPFSKDDMATL